MSILIALAIFGLVWYGCHKLLVWHSIRTKGIFRPPAVYRDPAEGITPDSRSRDIE